MKITNVIIFQATNLGLNSTINIRIILNLMLKSMARSLHLTDGFLVICKFLYGVEKAF